MLSFTVETILKCVKEGNHVSNSRGRKVKDLNQKGEADIFWMSLEEAKQVIGDKYDFLADRFERKTRKPS